MSSGRSFCWILLVCVVAIAGRPARTFAQERTFYQPTSPETDAAWLKAGGYRESVAFEQGTVELNPPGEGHLPLYRLGGLDLSLEGLPVVEVPFGIQVYGRGVSEKAMLSFGDAQLKGLVNQKNLKHLDLQYTGVTDKGLGALAGLKLESLLLPERARTDLGLRNYIAAHAPLRKLSFGWNDGGQPSRWSLTAASMKTIGELAPLQSLDLSEFAAGPEGANPRYIVDDAGFAELAGLVELRVLMLARTAVTDAGLQPLSKMTKLETLWLPKSVTDAGLVHLAGLKHLKTLQCESIGDAGLVEIAKLTSLESLLLGRSKVTDAGLAHLAPLKELRELILYETQISDAGVRHLMNFPKLELLNLSDTNVTRKGRDLLAPLQLKNLVVPRSVFAIRSFLAADAIRRDIGPAKREENHRLLGKQLDDMIASDPDYAESWVARGMLRRRWENDLPRAERDLQRGLELDPKQYLAHLELARIAAAREEPEAVRRLAKAGYPLAKAELKSKGDSARPGLDVIELAFRADEHEDVVELVSRLVAELGPLHVPHDSDRPLYRWRGLSRSALGLGKMAALDLKAGRATPEEIALYRSRDTKQVLADAWETIAVDDSKATPSTGKTSPEEIARRTKQIDEIVAARPQQAEPLALRGAFRSVIQRDFANGQKDLARAIELEPGQVRWREQLARSFRLEGKPAEARQAAAGWKRVVQLQGEDALSPQDFSAVVSLAFDAEDWADVVRLGRTRMRINGTFDPRLARLVILSQFAVGKTSEAEALRAECKAKSVRLGEDFEREVLLSQVRSPVLTAVEAMPLVEEALRLEAKPAENRETAHLMLNRIIERDPDFGPAYARRARIRWEQRKAAIKAADFHEAIASAAAVDDETLRPEWEQDITLFTVESIFADLDRAAERKVTGPELPNLRQEVLNEGVFVLGGPAGIAPAAIGLAAIDWKIGPAPFSAAAYDVDPAKGKGEAERLRERQAELRRDYPDPLGAIDAYSELIRETYGEHDPKAYLQVGMGDSGGIVLHRPADNPSARPTDRARQVAGWYFERGKALWVTGRTDVASLDFGMAAIFDPDRRSAIEEFLNGDGSKPVADAGKLSAARLRAEATEMEFRGDRQAAWDLIREAVAKDPSVVTKKQVADLKDNLRNSLFRTGDRFFEQKNYDRGLAAFHAAVEQFPDEIYNRRRLGEAYLGADQPAKALIELEAVIAEARRLLAALGDQHPDEGDAYRRFLGRSLLLKGNALKGFNVPARDIRGALDAFTEGLTFATHGGAVTVDAVRLSLARAGCLLALGRRDEAEAEFARYAAKVRSFENLRKSEEQWAAGFSLADQPQAGVLRRLETARLRFASGDFPGVVQDGTEALRLDPQNGSVLALRGQAHLHLKHGLEAVDDLRAASEKFPVPRPEEAAPPPAAGDGTPPEEPTWRGIRHRLAEAWLLAKRPEEGIATLTGILELDPKDVDALRIRSRAYVRLGEFDRCRQDLRAARALRPYESRLLEGEQLELYRAVLARANQLLIDEASIGRLVGGGITTRAELRGAIAAQTSDPEGAVSLWKPLADSGDGVAALRMAEACKLGRGTPRDLAKALEFATKAAERNVADADKEVRLLTLAAEFRNAD